MKRVGTLMVVALALTAATPARAHEQVTEQDAPRWYRDALVWEHPAGWLQSVVRSVERLRLQPARNGIEPADTARGPKPPPGPPEY